MINYPTMHRAKLRGIKTVCSESKRLPRNGYGPGVLEVFARRRTGEVWSVYHTDANSWTEYHDPDIILAVYLHRPATIREIREMVQDAITCGRSWTA